MRLPNVKMLLCWPSRMQIYGLFENHTFLEQFVSMGVPGHFSNLGVPGHFSNMIERFDSMGGTRTIFSTLHGSLWLGKDKGSIYGKRGDLWYHLAKHFNGMHGCDVVPIDVR